MPRCHLALIATLLLAPAAAPVLAAKAKGPTRAHTDQSNLFSNGDYPAAAVRARQQGRVEYEILVGPSGRIERCTILVSSGAAILDSTTCRLLLRRARFTPARDAKGRPTSDTLTGAFNWRLPR